MKLIKFFIIILVLSLIVSLNITVAQTRVSIQLNVADNGSGDTVLTFGVDKAATFCRDTLLYENECPPPPPTGVFDARFIDIHPVVDECLGQGIWVNFLPWATQSVLDSFLIKFQPSTEGGYPFHFSWHTGLGQYFDSLKMYWEIELAPGVFYPLVNKNMLTDTTYTVTNTSIIEFYIIGAPKANSVRPGDNSNPGQFALNQNYPNPFNPSTTITFTIEKAVVADIAIYDLLGRKVRTLAAGNLNPGNYTAGWNGIDDHGITVSSGVYYAKMFAHSNESNQAVFTAVRKLLLLK